MIDLGISDKVKVDLIPMEKNKVMLRIVNLADLYDGDNESDYRQIDTNAIAESLWLAANPSDSSDDFECKITEMSMTGNMPLKEMEERRLKWKTVDDDKT